MKRSWLDTASRDAAAPWLLIAYLWVCYSLNHADRQVVYSLFPALQKEFGYSDAVLGLTGALFLWVYGACSPFAGIAGDRFSKAALVAGSVGIWSTFTVLSGLSPNGAFLLVCRALLGISESMFMPAAYALMAAAHGPQTRSRAVGIFATSQLVGVALGGSMSGFVAERFNWRVSFWLLGGAGILFVWPLWRFLSRMPETFSRNTGPEKARLGTFFGLLKIPSLQAVTLFVSVSTFGLFLVYTWLPTFLYDKFHLGLARAGFEASLYPQIGTALGLLTGTTLADRFYRWTPASRLWVIATALFCATPCILLIGASPALESTRVSAMAFGFFSGWIFGNQAPAAFDVVPASLRASSVGVLNLLGALVSGFAPFLGGLARRTIGVDRLMAFTAVVYAATGLVLVYATLRHFARDHARALGAIFVLSIVASAPRVFAQEGTPFEQWLAEGGQTKMRWTVDVSGGQLSSHQRLLARATIQLDGDELDKRRGVGRLLLLVQFKDGAGRAYQTHRSFELQEVKQAHGQYFVYTQDAFVTPGDYQVTFAVLATATGEHSITQRTLHVAALKNDPLPEAWRDLPPVEFLLAESTPDAWYLPSVSGRLHLPLETRRPVRIELLVNLTPSEQASAMRRPGRTLGALIPALKAISQVDARNGSFTIAALDLARRRVCFEQASAGGLDWPRLKASLAQADPNVIDVHSLENRGQNAQFFVTEVSRRIAAAGEPARILIVLSRPVEFDRGEDLHPIQLPNGVNCRVFYIRDYSRPMRPPSAPLQPRSASGRRSIPPMRSASGAELDSLEQTLKPLRPRLFDVYSPEQFRKALRTLLDEISRM